MNKKLILGTYKEYLKSNNLSKQQKIDKLNKDITFFELADDTFKTINYQNYYNSIIFMRWMRLYKLF